jgi:16S rRNA A1518/A1519 N6-dimethyltransferase RsmA/KsgA/DIM1 with predicted DNA glycosylase/AP lyase activity
LSVWESKALLRQIYASFYDRIVSLMDSNLPGRAVEIGSGIGNLKARLPDAVCTTSFRTPGFGL